MDKQTEGGYSAEGTGNTDNKVRVKVRVRAWVRDRVKDRAWVWVRVRVRSTFSQP
jgi:hypothetical protein